MIISLIYLTDVSYIWHMLLWIVFDTLQYLTLWTLLYFIVSNICSYIWHLVQTLLLFHCVKYMSIYLTRCQIWAHISDTLSAAVEEVSNICSYIWHIVSVEYMMSDTKLDQFILSNICLYISHLVVWCQIYAYIFDTMEKYCHSQFERCVRYMSLYPDITWHRIGINVSCQTYAPIFCTTRYLLWMRCQIYAHIFDTMK